MVTTILGISPGTRSIGIGLVMNSEIVEWQVKTFKGRWSKEKMNLILETVAGLCTHFNVSKLAIKEVSPLSSSKNLNVLMEGIVKLARKKKIQVFRFKFHDLKRATGIHGKHSKDDVMEFITEKYPILRKEYLKERNNLNPYYERMFEAIAAALIVDKER